MHRWVDKVVFMLKMPKTDTLDTLDDEMKHTLNILWIYSKNTLNILWTQRWNLSMPSGTACGACDKYEVWSEPNLNLLWTYSIEEKKMFILDISEGEEGSRLEICCDRRSCKIFVSCVMCVMCVKQRSFLHISHVYTHLNVNFLHYC